LDEIDVNKHIVLAKKNKAEDFIHDSYKTILKATEFESGEYTFLCLDRNFTVGNSFGDGYEYGYRELIKNTSR